MVFFEQDRENAFLIELKGSDIKHAADQIGNSIRLLKEYYDSLAKCYIVHNNSPGTSTKLDNIKLKFFKRYGYRLSTIKSGSEINWKG
jgi:hypothetical protein